MHQIQCNFMDENLQAGKKSLMYAASKDLRVAVMESLREDTLPQKFLQKFRNSGNIEFPETGGIHLCDYIPCNHSHSILFFELSDCFLNKGCLS